MISIIVSSIKKEEYTAQLQFNISNTIGVVFEFIHIHNPGLYSLCEAYNMGVSKAKYNYLCFIHDDILFRVENWGLRLTELMKVDSKIGLIGVAGTKFKSAYPSAWGQSPYLYKFRRGHIIHKTNKEEYLEFDDTAYNKKEFEDVVCVDGVFLFTKKELFNNCKFDEKLLKHFHGYDIDFSLQIYFEGYRVLVDRIILIEHHSGGNHSTQNTIANRLISKKWKAKLPVTTIDTETNIARLWLLECLNWAYFLKNALLRKLKIK